MKGDLARPVPTLERFVQRKDASARLRARIERWIQSLREIPKRPPETSPLAEGAALLAVAQDRGRFPDERDALVYDLAASGALHRFADATPAGPEAAFAYWRLGQIESRIGRSFWLSQTEAYLERRSGWRRRSRSRPTPSPSSRSSSSPATPAQRAARCRPTCATA